MVNVDSIQSNSEIPSCQKGGGKFSNNVYGMVVLQPIVVVTVYQCSLQGMVCCYLLRYGGATDHILADYFTIHGYR